MRGKPGEAALAITAGEETLRGSTNLNNALLDIQRAVLLVADPGDALVAKSADAHPQDTAEERVGGGNGETKAGSKSEIGGRGDDGADHAQHEHGGAVAEGLGVDDLGPDGVGDPAADSQGAGELHDGGAHHGLHVRDGAGRDGRGPRVGHIVGADVPGVEEGKDCAHREEVVVLTENSHGCGVVGGDV